MLKKKCTGEKLHSLRGDKNIVSSRANCFQCSDILCIRQYRKGLYNKWIEWEFVGIRDNILIYTKEYSQLDL